jgi:hypothetical protein
MNTAVEIATLTVLQGDVLRAAFVVDETGVAAWRRWRDATDWEGQLDHDAFRLLPRIYGNLRRQGIADPLLPRLQGITRQAWYANQRRLRQFRPTLQALAAAGVEPLITPPTAVLLHDATAVFAPQAALSCAVRGAHVEAAIRCLRGSGWRTSVGVPRWSTAGYVLAADRLAWYDGEGQTLELSWQWDATDQRGRFPGEVWQRAGHARLANHAVRALDAADAVHELCQQPAAANTFASIVELLLCLAGATTPPDWRQLLARVALAPVAPAWRGIFEEVHALFPAIVPTSVITDWPSRVPQPSPVPSGTIRERVALHWSTYRDAWGGDYSFARAVRHLPGYLLARWRLPALGGLPLRFWRGLRYEWRDAHRRP